jgi:pyrimidine-nucleoside phosphorylase
VARWQGAVAIDARQADRRRVISAAELIQRKRDGHELSHEEISWLILGYARGEIPDYQLAAFCMAVFFRGLSSRETFALTDAMIKSGETLDLGAALGRKVVDKHSTGGVGDKTSLAVGPIVAACGVPFGKMSGRGLGHTGGTLDKLESIPGFRVALSTDEFVAQVRRTGIAIVGQTADLVPADLALYGLRDVTATVDQLSLIAASIMSKKLAAGAQAIVLDVKVGRGAFMKTLDDARALADAMLALGHEAGRQVVCLLTDMDQPLGAAVGNALEVREALATLRGHGPTDFTELVIDACARLLALSDLGIDTSEGRARAERAVLDGSAEAVWNRWLEAQGGTAAESALEHAPIVREVTATRAGTIEHLDAVGIGAAAVHLGAGRRVKTDTIDHAVGIVCLRKRGDHVEVDDVLAEVHARTDAAATEAVREVAAAYEVGERFASPRPVLLEVVS